MEKGSSRGLPFFVLCPFTDLQLIQSEFSKRNNQPFEDDAYKNPKMAVFMLYNIKWGGVFG